MTDYILKLGDQSDLAALSRNEARVKRQSNVFGQAREIKVAFLSRHLPHSLAHRVAQLAVEFSPTHHTLVVHPGDQPPPRFLLGSIEPWHGVRGVPTHPRSSPLAQDSSWSRTALRAAAHSLPRSVATRPSRHASVSVTARHGSRAPSKDSDPPKAERRE